MKKLFGITVSDKHLISTYQYLLYILTSVWLLRTPNNNLSLHFCKKLMQNQAKMSFLPLFQMLVDTKCGSGESKKQTCLRGLKASQPHGSTAEINFGLRPSSQTIVDMKSNLILAMRPCGCKSLRPQGLVDMQSFQTSPCESNTLETGKIMFLDTNTRYIVFGNNKRNRQTNFKPKQ